MKIGLVGEAPYDTNSIENLLTRQAAFSGIEFCVLINDIHGSNLDSQKVKRFLRREYEDQKPDVVIFIRDLDGTLTNNHTLEFRRQYFRESNTVVDKRGIFLLNIFEIEALLISDLPTFNQHFKCNVTFEGDPMMVEMPKEFLKTNCKKYIETSNSEIFKQLVFETLLQKCKYFEDFILKLKKTIGLLEIQ